MVNSPWPKTRTAAPTLKPSASALRTSPHATGRRFEAVQDRAVADAEFGLAGLALEVREVLLATVAATADEGVDVFIGDADVQAVRVVTGIPSRRDPLFAERATRASYL